MDGLCQLWLKPVILINNLSSFLVSLSNNSVYRCSKITNNLVLLLRDSVSINQLSLFIAFPNEPTSNYLVLKGKIADNFGNYHPLKFILPTNYPLSHPRVYFDKQLSVDIVSRLPYIGV